MTEEELNALESNNCNHLGRAPIFTSNETEADDGQYEMVSCCLDPRPPDAKGELITGGMDMLGHITPDDAKELGETGRFDTPVAPGRILIT